MRGLLSLAVGCVGSLEGLYVLEGTTGQLQQVNRTDGSRTAVGTPLAGSGWAIEDACAPVTVDQTIKIHYTLARPSASPESVWTLVGASLQDGSILSHVPLPTYFRNEAKACEYTLDIDDNDRVLVSGVAGGQLLTVQINPRVTEGRVVLIANITLADQPAGAQAEHPSSTFDIVRKLLWYQLEHGLAVVNVTAKTLQGSVPFPSGRNFTGLSFDTGTEKVFALVVGGDKVAVAGIDAAAWPPAVAMVGGFAPGETLARSGASTTVIVRDQQLVTLGTASMLTVAYDGSLVHKVPVCDSACPASVVYEPYVFRAMLV